MATRNDTTDSLGGTDDGIDFGPLAPGRLTDNQRVAVEALASYPNRRARFYADKIDVSDKYVNQLHRNHPAVVCREKRSVSDLPNVDKKGCGGSTEVWTFRLTPSAWEAYLDAGVVPEETQLDAEAQHADVPGQTHEGDVSVDFDGADVAAVLNGNGEGDGDTPDDTDDAPDRVRIGRGNATFEGKPVDVTDSPGERPLGSRPVADSPEPIESIGFITTTIAKRLRDAGFETADDVRAAPAEELQAAKQIGRNRAREIAERSGDPRAITDEPDSEAEPEPGDAGLPDYDDLVEAVQDDEEADEAAESDREAYAAVVTMDHAEAFELLSSDAPEWLREDVYRKVSNSAADLPDEL